MLFAIIFPLLVSAQKKDAFSLKVELADRDSTFLIDEEIKFQTIHNSAASVEKELQKLKMQLTYRSYMTASVDSLVNDSLDYVAYIDVGESFKWAELRRGNAEENILDKIGFREQFYQKKPFYYQEVGKLIESIQEYCENNGFPFATVGLDSVQISADNRISAQLNVRKNNFITFKEIKLVGDDVKISKRYLQNYLGIQPDEPYSLKKIKDIPRLIRELPFLKETKSPILSFRGSEATVNLFLAKKKASKFDFLVGVLPRNESTGNRLLITIDGMFSTQNLLGAGEKFFVEFRQVQAGTQRMDLEVSWPYIIDLFGAEADFSLYKRDSTYLDIEYDVGISYSFSARHSLTAFWHNRNTFLLEVDKDRIRQTKKLPENLDTRFTDFGLRHHIEDLDYRFNPRKGWSITTRASAGFKSIQTNNEIKNLLDPLDPTFDFASLYDDLDARSIQYQIGVDAWGFLPFYPKQRGVLAIHNQTGGLLSPNPVFLNEQFRIGGSKILRGFDEESVPTSLYSIFSLEYRFIIGRNSYIYLFGDYGFSQSNSPSGKTNDTPLGFGAGFTFETGAGIFGISGAYGKQFNNPIDFRAAKIHFGYLSYF
ncbi:MAG: BamA/TamA family outer membrane protein [Saprospiraceae bacterium]